MLPALTGHWSSSSRTTARTSCLIWGEEVLRAILAVAVACVGLIGSTAAADVQASMRRQTNIAPQHLAPALTALAEDRSVHLIYRSELVQDQHTSGAAGDLTLEEALKQLLSGTGLTYKFLDSHAITIIPAGAAEDNGAAVGSQLKLAEVSPGTRSDEDVNPGASKVIQEVVVTAQKRVERLQDVPVPVTALDAQALVDTNQLRVQEYYTSVPGVSLSTGAHGQSYMSIRGIMVDFYANPSVAIAIDDVPYGSSTRLGGGYIAPDIDPSDLQRVEVLRGPQGTLYGASSIGGLIKYVTADPSTDGPRGYVQVGRSDAHNGDDLGYSMRGTVNLPLGDTLAVRAGGYTRHDPGYVDNVRSGERDVNEADAQGGRLASLWRPSDAFSLKLSALVQDYEASGLSSVFEGPEYEDLQQDVLRGTGQHETRAQSYSATITSELSQVALTSLTGYNIQRSSTWFDVTPLYGSYTEDQYGLAGASSEDFRKTSKFTQEIRLETPVGQKLDWLVGAFYTDEDSDFGQEYFAVDPATGELGPQFVQGSFPTTYSEYALFTDLTLRINDRFDVQVGGRESHIEQTLTQTLSGPLVGGTRVSKADSDADAFTYLVTPRFRVSTDLLVYARLASGYRPGGPNVNAGLLGLPPQYDPDKTDNYEVGVKGNALDHKLSFDASVYYIDWKDVQRSLIHNGFSFFSNAGRAKSQGLELSIESRPLAGLTVSAWAAWGDAVLSEALPANSPSYGASGDRLPFSPRFSGNLSVQQDFHFANQVTAVIGGTVSYVGDRVGAFRGTPERQSLPSYARTDLRAGVRYGSWTVNAFVTNLTDERGVLAGGLDAVPTHSFNYIAPRTVGLSFSKFWD